MTNTNNTPSSPINPGTESPSLQSADSRIRLNFEDALTVVDESGVVELLDGPQAGTGKGERRTRSITTRAFYVAAVMNALEDGPSEITAITATFNTLPEDLLRKLDVPDAIPAGKVPHHRVSYAWNRITDACNPSPHHAGRRLKIVDGTPVDERHPERIDGERLTPEEQATRRSLLNAVTDQLLQATIPADYEPTSWAVDWTAVTSLARTYRAGESTSADPDARWGRRSRRGPRSTSDALFADRDELFFGYNAHIAVTAPAVGGVGLAGALRLTPANDMIAVAPTLVELTDALLSAGRAVSTLAIDAGYSMRKFSTWLTPLSNRGVSVTYELSKQQLGRHDSHDGAVLIGGVPHCPMTPAVLTNEKVPRPQATRAEWENYWQNRDNLDKYAFGPLGTHTPDLVQRFHCPAYAGKIRCPQQPSSMTTPADSDNPEIHNLPEAPPRCCTSSNVTLGHEVGLGSRQAHPDGSRAWIESYNARMSAERYMGGIRTGQTNQARVLGLAKVSLMLSFTCAATNIREVRSWKASQAGTAVPQTHDTDPNATS